MTEVRLIVGLFAGLAISFLLMTGANGMQRIEAGSYPPLFKSIESQNRVRVKAFLMDRYAVTNAEFYQFTQLHPKWSKSNIKPVFADTNYLKHLSAENLSTIGDQPVTNISWFAARAYCKTQQKRLPSNHEWEFAAYSDRPEDRRRILEWYSRPAIDKLPSVIETEPNPRGLYGMHGVIWELVDDFNSALVTGESRGDSQLERSLFCGAGAAASLDPSDYAAFMRYALRSSYQAHYTMTSLGFRCARDLTPAELADEEPGKDSSG